MDKTYLSMNPTEIAVLDAASRIFVLKMQGVSSGQTEEVKIMHESIKLAITMAKEIEIQIVGHGETG